MQSLQLDEFSFWERRMYFEGIDFLVVGSGIVGLSTAIHLKKSHPTAKIVVVERGILPSGASTKNAGFACFGSPTELLDDLKTIPETSVWKTVEKRWKGLQALKELLGTSFSIEQHGSWDLLMHDESDKETRVNDQLGYLNAQMEEITGEKGVFSQDNTLGEKFGFQGIHTSFYNRLEGQLDTDLMIDKLYRLAQSLGIHVVFGIEIRGLQVHLYNVGIQSSIGYFKASKVAICTNGFAQELLPGMDVQPARAQVLVTTPIYDLKIKGTFHYDCGYYYFRNVEDRILIGGGRNLDFEGETTTQLGVTNGIQSAIEHLLREVILPNDSFDIAYRWSGIMGIGKAKEPIVQSIDDKIAIGVRMGGMGVAIGTLVGQELAELLR